MHNSDDTTVLPESITEPMRKVFKKDLFDTAITLTPQVLLNLIDTLKHARTFIISRNKMHQTGVELYDELIVFLENSGKEI